MRIQVNINQMGNTGFSAAGVNASVSGLAGVAVGLSKNKNQAAMSPQEKLAQMIGTLQEQKDLIVERRNELIEDTIKKGGDLDDIEVQLKDFETRLKDLDDQIKEIYARQLKETLENEEKDEKKSSGADTDKSRDRLEMEHMFEIAHASEDVKQSEKIASAKNRVQGDIHIKEAELHQDSLQKSILETQELRDPGSAEILIRNLDAAMRSKEGVISGMKERLGELAAMEGKSMEQILEKLEEYHATHFPPEEGTAQDMADYAEKYNEIAGKNEDGQQDVSTDEELS